MSFKIAQMLKMEPFRFFVAVICSLLASFGAAVSTTAADTPVPGAKTPARIDLMIKAGAAPANKFCAVLPDGATFELVGVGESAGDDKQWWNADGSPRAKPGHVAQVENHGDAGRMCRLFVFACKRKEAASVAEPFFLSETESGTSWWFTEDLGSQQTASTLAVDIRLQSRATIRLKYAADEWTTIATCPPTHGTVVANAQGGVLFGDPIEKNGETVLPVAVKLAPHDCRIDAIDHASRAHHSTVAISDLAEDIRLLSPRFPNLRLAQIKEFRVQTRAWRQIEFRNISLHRGQKTNFGIFVDAEPSAAEAARATRK
jgi:hypothetical protein